jgi:glycine/D-amino acid oxidase-like deaminating enzyme
VLVEDGRLGEGSDVFLSGSAGPAEPAHSKMLTTYFESHVERIVAIHGATGARTYLEVARLGLRLYQAAAAAVGEGLVRQLGAVAVGNAVQLQWIRQELARCEAMQLPHEFRLCSRAEVAQMLDSDHFDGGMYSPSHATADQGRYLRELARQTPITVLDRTRVCRLQETREGAIVTTNNRGEFLAKQVVTATNGFSIAPALQGLVRPHWSFVLCFRDPGPNTPNAWTFSRQYIYFTRQDNVLLVGGEDRRIRSTGGRYLVDERGPLARLRAWALRKLPRLSGRPPCASHYGVFARTSDELPIVGRRSAQSPISYLIGCNGVGQTMLTYAASLMPGILGYAPLTARQRRHAEFLSARRPTLK